MGVDKRMG